VRGELRRIAGVVTGDRVQTAVMWRAESYGTTVFEIQKAKVDDSGGVEAKQQKLVT
jgi:hypothetical protein